MRVQPCTKEPPDERPIDDIEDEIASLSATIQAATYRLLCLVEEYDRRSGWADPLNSNGFRSCAHWLSWRVGVDLSTARQQVRVARALPKLPRISAAFAAGEISYSKARAITRIADADNEELLLDWALAGTASHVEKLVRTYRRADVGKENERAAEQERTRQLVTFYDSDGMLVVRGRLTPEQGALLNKALEASRDELYSRKDGSAEPSPADDPTPEANGMQLMADALARVAERALADGAAGSASADRFQVVVHVDAEVLAAPETDGQCALEDGTAIAAETARRLACDASVYELEHGPQGELRAGRKTRVVSTTLRRALRARDGTRCVFPGCNCRGRDAHHVKHWAEHGPTVLANIVSLCRAHHTLVHEGGYRVEPLSGGRLRFVRPDGRELLPAPALPAVTCDVTEALTARWVPAEVTITPSTGRPTWDGEPADYDWMLGLLFSHRAQDEHRDPDG